MSKKSFFRERNTAEIEDLEIKGVYSSRRLVEKILGLDAQKESLELRFQIRPGRFYQQSCSNAEASRKCLKHGDLIALSQPETQKDAYSFRDIPLAVRAKDFSKLQGMKEEEIDFIGYSFRPVQGRDRRKRIVPFVWLLEGIRLFNYSENQTNGVEIESYDDAKKASKEGASIVCKVPSRTRKNPRYRIRLDHVPINGDIDKRAIIWGLKPSTDKEIIHKAYFIKYTWGTDREESDVITFYPHDITAYISIAGSFWKNKYNLTPMEMNPFALASKLEADFYKKLCNNIIIFDPSLKNKDRLRKLNIDEKSILLARSIGVLGHDKTFFWDPDRDGKLKDYNWSIISSL